MFASGYIEFPHVTKIFFFGIVIVDICGSHLISKIIALVLALILSVVITPHAHRYGTNLKFKVFRANANIIRRRM